jgi:superoxide dismutase
VIPLHSSRLCRRTRSAITTASITSQHADDLDHQNLRPGFVEVYLAHIINWDFAAQDNAAAA